jgi:hypothetical protein
MKFFDDNTRSWWTPITGGANVPALNELLAPHGITLGERILQGTTTLGKHSLQVRLHGCCVCCAQQTVLDKLQPKCVRAAGVHVTMQLPWRRNAAGLQLMTAFGNRAALCKFVCS